jgi:hypothetical protein
MNKRIYSILSTAFWTLLIAIVVQFSILGWSRDQGVAVLRICILMQSALALPMLIIFKAKWIKIILTVGLEWIAFLILAPSITMA